MKYSESLKKNKDFQKVYSEKKSYANKYLVMYTMKNNTDQNRLGISVSKKCWKQYCSSQINKIDQRKLSITRREISVRL